MRRSDPTVRLNCVSGVRGTTRTAGPPPPVSQIMLRYAASRTGYIRVDAPKRRSHIHDWSLPRSQGRAFPAIVEGLGCRWAFGDQPRLPFRSIGEAT